VGLCGRSDSLNQNFEGGGFGSRLQNKEEEMYLIKEVIRGVARFGTDILPEFGRVDWGRSGENAIEVPDALGHKLILYGRNRVYREVKFPVAKVVAPLIVEETPVVELPKPVRTRSPNGTRKPKRK
jgi:hypothetical protein